MTDPDRGWARCARCGIAAIFGPRSLVALGGMTPLGARCFMQDIAAGGGLICTPCNDVVADAGA